MRTASVEIAGERHLLCLSTRVVADISDRHGSFEAFFAPAEDARSGGQKLRDTLELLAALMAAGDRYARRHGIQNAAPLTQEELLDETDLGDLAALRAKIAEAIAAGSSRDVEADPPKNSEAAQAAAPEQTAPRG